jgi:hypothetical protein
VDAAAVMVAAADVDAVMAVAESAALRVLSAVLELSPALRVVLAALELSPAALELSAAGAAASGYTADAHFLDAASAAVAPAGEAVGAAELAGYGHPPGAGSTPAGLNLHLQAMKLASFLSKSNKGRCLRKRSSETSRQLLRFSTAPAAWQYSPRSAAPTTQMHK